MTTPKETIVLYGKMAAVELCHFLLTRLKQQGIDDALIQILDMQAVIRLKCILG